MRLSGLILLVVATPWLVSAQAPAIPIRMWFAYGDEASAQRARASGVDPSAAVGREIAGRLAVPTSGRAFKVQFWCEMSNPAGVAELALPSINVAFDRTFCGDANQNPPLNSQSFRKVRPAGANQNNYLEAFSNGAIVPAWRNANTISDLDNNGVQDTAQIDYLQRLPSAWRQGTQGLGESLRPVGLATYLGARIIDPPGFPNGLYAFKIPNATPMRLFDLNWVSMMSLADTYGTKTGETGLTITASPQIGLANSTSIIGSSAHTGAKYSLVAVAPEPNGLLALAASILLARRRR